MHAFKHCESATHERFCEHAVPALQQLCAMQSLHATTVLENPQLPLPPVPPMAGGAVQGTFAVGVQPPEMGGRSSEQPNDQQAKTTAKMGARHTNHERRFMSQRCPPWPPPWKPP